MWLCPALVLAATPASPSALGVAFDEALARAEAVGDVAAAERAAQVRRDGLHHSAFTTNPQLSVQPGLRLESGAARPEGQLTVSQSLSLAGLGAARSATQRSDLELAGLEHRRLRLERRVAVATAWVELWAAQEASRLAHDEEGNARDLLERLQRAGDAGATTRVELATARAFTAELAALHLEWEGRRVDQGARVADLLGLDTLAEALGPLPAADATDVLALAPDAQLPVKVAQQELASERARLDESAAQWGPQLQLSLQGGHEAPSQWFANAGFGLTLPLFERGKRERTAHEAALAKLSAGAALAERRARIGLQAMAHELEHTAETLRLLSDEQLPAAEEAVTLEAKRFAQGEATLLELTLLRRQALSARIATALARARYAGASAKAKELSNP